MRFGLALYGRRSLRTLGIVNRPGFSIGPGVLRLGIGPGARLFNGRRGMKGWKNPPLLFFTGDVGYQGAVDLFALFGVTIDQRGIAEEVDEAWHAVAVTIDGPAGILFE